MTEVSIGKEFLELAIEIERNGRFFYEAVARLNRNNAEVTRSFSALAVREQEHENTFRDMLVRLGGYTPGQQYAGEHYQYIKDLARSSIFTGERVQAVISDRPMTDLEALETGIGFEKDSILFYSEIRGMVPPQDQDIVDIIINEERKHLSELTYMVGRVRSST